MSDEWSTAPLECETAADLWLPSKSGAFSNRKLQSSQPRRKNNDKRDSVAQLAALADGSPKKLREKPSWLGLARGYATTTATNGQWVRVRCSLSANQSQCTLNIIGDKATLQHSVYINKLRTTNIRFADRSLFWRNDCLAIHVDHDDAFALHSPSRLARPVSSRASGQSQTHRRHQSSAPIYDPIFLAFESKEVVNCWSALLRSYAKPEIYGRHVTDGGLYRMWRQIDLTIVSGRNLGIPGKVPGADGLTSNSSLAEVDRGDEGTPDLELFCEIMLDEVLSGQTTLKKGEVTAGTECPTWTWHEGFVLSDLPPFGALEIRVWRDKKAQKPMLVGTVEVPLPTLRRGHLMEGWWPVLVTAPGGNGIQVGDIKLKIKVDEEIILPMNAYAAITATLDNQNSLDLLNELDQKLQLSDISWHMLALAVGRGTFLKDVFALAEREVGNAPNANTLFRGNTVFTKTVEQAMSFFGKSFLEASVGPCILELCRDHVEIETDPSRNPRPKEIEASVKLLPIWCSKFWSQIYKVRGDCPMELRRLFHYIREAVERRFGTEATNLRWQSVSAFCFLRLIVPAILHPHLFGLHPGLPSPGTQRSLTLIAKAMQSLANLSREQKEIHMQSVHKFLEENIPAMINYINTISTPLPDRLHSEVSDRYGRLHIMHSLRDRARTLPPLTSESIPMLPHLLDIPKHMAILSSAVIRHTHSIPRSAPRPTPLARESLVEDFAVKCFEIEAKAVQSVSRLATPIRSVTALPRHSRRVPSRRSSDLSQDDRPIEPTRHPPISSADSPIPRTPNSPRKSRKSSRPSTAPAAASSGSPVFQAPIPSPPSSSPITFAPRRGHSNDGSSPSPNSSYGFLDKQSPTSPTRRTATSATASSFPPFPRTDPTRIRRTLSQQLPISGLDNAEELAKRRGFLRNFLSRTK